MLLKVSDKKYITFEVNGHLFQFHRILFRAKKRAALFQRKIDKIIKKKNLCSAFPYIDDITIAGRRQAEHNQYRKSFLEAIMKAKITLNKLWLLYGSLIFYDTNFFSWDSNNFFYKPIPKKCKVYIYRKNFEKIVILLFLKIPLIYWMTLYNY